MNVHETEFKFAEVMRLLGRPVTFYPGMAHALGNVNAGLFLSNFLYWEGKQADKKAGWIYKSQREIQLETGLSRYQQESARRTLKQYAIMEEVKRGQPGRMHYRFNWEKLNALLAKHFKGVKIEKEKIEDTTIFKMKRLFDKHYLQLSNGVKFEWGQASSKEWRGLKHLSIALEDVIAFKRCHDMGIDEPTGIEKDRIDVTQADILNSFDGFLQKLPEWHKVHSMNPADLYSRFSKIIIEIQTNINGRQIEHTPHDYTSTGN